MHRRTPRARDRDAHTLLRTAGSVILLTAYETIHAPEIA